MLLIYFHCMAVKLQSIVMKIIKNFQNSEDFSEKVLMYLWNDAFKYNHDKVFKDEYKTLDKLIMGFKNQGFKVFADEIKFQTGIDMTKSAETPNAVQ